MIELVRGNVLDAEVEALVNPVNCVGVMGKGLALQCRRAFPEAFKVYARACRIGELQPGRVLVVEVGGRTPPRFVVHFPTKRHWRDASRLEDIAGGLEALVAVVRARGIRSLAVPALGCGLGGLRWEDVRPCIERALGPCADVRTLLFEPA